MLWRLRQTFQSLGAPADEYVSIKDDNAWFSTTSRYWLDVEVFEMTVARYRDVPGQALTLEQATELDQVVELYTGDLLEGIYDDWCQYDRERLRLLHLNALGKLMAFHEENGTYERGLMYGQRILDKDETRDDVHRLMMRLYWLAGDRNAAMAQYKSCVQALWEGLGISPLHETSATYQQMITPARLPDEARELTAQDELTLLSVHPLADLVAANLIAETLVRQTLADRLRKGPLPVEQARLARIARPRVDLHEWIIGRRAPGLCLPQCPRELERAVRQRRRARCAAPRRSCPGGA